MDTTITTKQNGMTAVRTGAPMSFMLDARRAYAAVACGRGGALSSRAPDWA